MPCKKPPSAAPRHSLPGSFPSYPLCIQRLSCPGSLAKPMSVPVAPRVPWSIPARAVRWGRIGSPQQGCAQTRPAGAPCCVQAVWLVINFLLGLGTGQNQRRKRPGVAMGQATTSSYSPVASSRPGSGCIPPWAWLLCPLPLQAPWPLATVNLRGFMVSCLCGFCSPLQ